MGISWRLLANSVAVSGLTTLLACLFGFCAAAWLAGLPRRARKTGLIAGIVALGLPPFLATNCWIHLLGATGVWRAWLPVSIYSLGGVVWILALMYWPITLLLVFGEWEKIERTHFEIDPALRGFSLVRWLLWPAARAATGQAALITFVLALNHFAVPAILQVKVFPAEVWLKLSTELDYAAAWRMSMPLIAISVVAVLLLRRRGRELAWPRQQGAAHAKVFRRQFGRVPSLACGALMLIVIFCSVLLPLGEVLADAKTWTELPKDFAAVKPLVNNSFLFAAGAATVCLICGLGLWRWRIGWIVWILFLLPGVLVAAGLIYVFNRPVLDAIYQSAAVVLIAFTLRYVALSWQGARQALQQVDRELIDAVRLETASRWRLFWTAHWPQARPTLAAVWYITYLLCLWDVESLVMIYPPGGETLALRVFNLLHYGHIAQVNALCLLLLGLAVLPLLPLALQRGECNRR